ncbi:hypothetical protein [Thiocystis violacea]|uniref:hypothetical protein n=1 Tax=Thiocystis violacea TaxID=13725 RepID=UPI0019062464|nr:hypothetical protein [Thiocystis violacea]MBK1718763.1 hypothetical protein [Thiocystis violacea]
MIRFAVATEDALSEAVAETLLRQVGDHSVDMRLRKDGFGYLKGRIRDFNRIAMNVMPVLLLTDLDRMRCAPELRAAWLLDGPHPRLLFRVAVRETESWLLADRLAFAEFLGIAIARIPDRPDDLTDPKAALLNLVRRSRRRNLKQEILPAPGVSFPVGLGYDEQLSGFVRDQWDCRRAAKTSPSLARAVACVERCHPIMAES